MFISKDNSDDFRHCYGVSIVGFDQVNDSWVLYYPTKQLHFLTVTEKLLSSVNSVTDTSSLITNIICFATVNVGIDIIVASST